MSQYFERGEEGKVTLVPFPDGKNDSTIEIEECDEVLELLNIDLNNDEDVERLSKLFASVLMDAVNKYGSGEKTEDASDE